MASTQSTVTLQSIADILSTIIDIQPILSVGGYSNLTMLTIANDVMNEICAQPFPWKWNEFQVPQFCANSWQQDYAIPGLTNLASLQRGIIINISSTSIPKPWRYVQVVREQTEATSAWNGPCPFSGPSFKANWMLNSNLYYGVWGDAPTGNSTLGNNPVANSIYTNPLGAGSQPSNPITQIIDANGNLLVLTGYGTEGTTAPVAPVNSLAGTLATPGAGATTQWMVVDPNGQGMRIDPVPSQTGAVWQFNLSGQAQPVRFTSLSQTLFPLTDNFETTFRQGCTAQAYRYSQSTKVREKFDKEWTLWLRSLVLARQKEDKERDASRMQPARTVLGSGGSRGSWGATWPWRF
jgi:hypothetical protein